MTTICGTTLNDNGERCLKITLSSFAVSIFLAGFIMAIVSRNEPTHSLFAAGIIVAFVGILFGIGICLVTKCCGCRRNEYEPISTSYPSIV